MSLPSDKVAPFEAPAEFAHDLGDALGVAPPKEIFRSRYLLAVWDEAKEVRAIKSPDGMARLLRTIGMWGLIATAKGDDGYDFVSRFFAPDKGVPEDPVTGSAHCTLTPFWAKRLSKKTMHARQVSKRGGDLTVTDEGARAVISGPCALYMTGEIEV
jgi:predicted PhzF superfamily epimerase YddE/YHI9